MMECLGSSQSGLLGPDKVVGCIAVFKYRQRRIQGLVRVRRRWRFNGALEGCEWRCTWKKTGSFDVPSPHRECLTTSHMVTLC